MLRCAAAIAVSALVASLVVLGSGSAAAEAAGGEITFRVRGSVNLVFDLDASGVPQVGESYVLDYTFDPLTPAGYETPIFANYPAVTAMTITFSGGYGVSSPAAPGNRGSISVTNDYSLNQGRADLYRTDFFGFIESTSIGLDLAEVFMELGAYQEGAAGPTAITGLTLPTAPPNPADFASYAYLALIWQSPTPCDDGPPDCGPSGGIQASIDSLEIVVDANGDGVAEDIAATDTGGQAIAGAFDDGAGTTGQILTGSGILIQDASAPDGVRITTTAPATLRVCGFFMMSVAAGSDLVITCGSITARVTLGSATIGLGADGDVTVPAGASVTVDRDADGNFSARNHGMTAVQVTRGGVTVELAPGNTLYGKPRTKQECKKGGWQAFGIYRNQGQCVSSITGHA